MGYYTDYELELTRKDGKELPNYEDVAEQMKTIAGNGYHSSFSELLEGYSVNWKWYDSTKEMCKLSEKFPGVLFTLSGDGEGYEDRWKEYFYNGKYQHEDVEYKVEEFDENKLKSL